MEYGLYKECIVVHSKIIVQLLQDGSSHLEQVGDWASNVVWQSADVLTADLAPFIWSKRGSLVNPGLCFLEAPGKRIEQRPFRLQYPVEEALYFKG